MTKSINEINGRKAVCYAETQTISQRLSKTSRYYNTFVPKNNQIEYLLRKNEKRDTLSRNQERDVKHVYQIFDGLRNATSSLVDSINNSKTITDGVAGMIDPIKSTVNRISDTAQHVLPELRNTVDNMSNISDVLQQALSSIQEVFGSLKCTILDTNIMSHIMKLIDLLVNVSFSSSENRLKAFFWNLFTKFGYDIYHYVLSMCVGKSKVNLQLNDGIMGIMNCLSGLPDYLNTGFTVPIVGALLTSVFMAALGLPNKVSFPEIVNFYGTKCRNAKFMLDFVTGYQPMFANMADYLCEHILGKSSKAHQIDEIVKGFEVWAEEVMNLNSDKEPLSVRMERDEKLYFRVDYLYKKGMSFCSDLSLKRLDNKLTLYFNKLFAVVEAAKKLSDYSGVFGNKPRIEPTCIQLFGESGVGKSGMSWPLASDMNALFADSVDQAKNYAQEIYFRNTEQEFWDGYTGQNIVCIDDFGQRADSQAAPNEEFMELIRMINLAPYPLHMAELAEKKRTKFTSKVVLLTCNVLTQNVNSLTFPDAYRRRIDVCGQVRNKAEYVKMCFSSTTQTITPRLDPMKCSGPIDTDCYEIVMYDAETMQPICKDGVEWIVNYDEFLSLCIAKCQKKVKISSSVNSALTNRMTEERFNTIKANFQVDLGLVYGLNFACDQLRNYYTNYLDIRFDNIKEFIKHHTLSYYEKVKSVITSFGVFKTIMITVGVILAGLGIWKCLSNKRDRIRYENECNTSGDRSTHKTQTVVTEASSSGDHLTKSKPTFVTEATASGDHITKCKSTVVTEASASGDNKTLNKSVVVTEAMGSGDSVTKHRPTIVTECSLNNDDININTLANLQAWRDASAQDLISTRILSNLYAITRSNGSTILNGLFVRDTIMLVPRHIRLETRNMKSTDTLTFTNVMGSVFTLPLSDIVQIGINDSEGGEKDAMLWQFPRYVNAHSDLVKHFQTMPELARRKCNVILPVFWSLKTQLSIKLLGNAEAKMEVRQLDTNHGMKIIRDCITYDLPTRFGDCGSPVICQDTSFIRKIAGIHIAAASDGSEAFAQSITQQDLLRTLSHFDKVIITDSDNIANIKVTHSVHQLSLDVEYTKSTLQKLFDIAADTFSYLGKCTQPLFSPSNTEVRPSVIHNQVTESITKPAILYHKEVNMLNHNLKKCGVNTPYIPKAEIQRAVNSYKPILLSKKVNELCRILTYEEAISGSEDSSFLSGITRKSSPGYPYVLTRPSGKPGKTAWFGDVEYIYDAKIKERVDVLASLAKQGIRAPYVWTDTLKDERRPIQKVDELKTRVFASGPQDYLILFRMYFLGFVANVMENRVNNEQSIGTNPFNSDWGRTAHKLSRFGDKVFAGDFSTFDGTLNSCIMHAFVDVINEWYDDGEENALLRHTLFLDIMNSVHLSGDKFYACTHSQPSGNPLTTILNSWYNSVSMRIAFYRCAEKHGIKNINFNDVVSMVSYGDDNVINFSDKIVSWFNQVEVTEAYASFGMIYTDEAKSGIITPYKKLHECAYLKRGFRYDEGKWFAPLDFTVCMEMCNWIRKSSDPSAATKENIENACRELSLHGESIFDLNTKRLIQAFYRTTGEYPYVKSYSEYLNEMNES